MCRGSQKVKQYTVHFTQFHLADHNNVAPQVHQAHLHSSVQSFSLVYINPYHFYYIHYIIHYKT